MKRRAWSSFSRYVRLRDCLKTTGTPDHGICYTCGKELEFSKLQAGHLVDGRTNAVLFDEDNVKAQCFSCNVPGHGRQGTFVIKKIEELMEQGLSLEESFEKVKSLFSPEKVEYTSEDYIEIEKRYRKKYEELEKKCLK